MTSSRLLTLTMALVALTATLGAHHSFAAYYFEDQLIEVEGAISSVEFKAPHAWVHIAARDAAGKERTYSAEWSNPSRLERDGITRETLKVGDMVHVWGAPSRDASDNRMHLKRIHRASDGWQWRGGNRREAR